MRKIGTRDPVVAQPASLIILQKTGISPMHVEQAWVLQVLGNCAMRLLVK
jgi:hypothetical protein